MDLGLRDQRFIVCGASSGFGRAIAEQLLDEGAKIIAVARRQTKLNELTGKYPETIDCIVGDLQEENVHNQIEHAVGPNPLHGIVFNAGGPPTGSALSTNMKQWDAAYHMVVRWKIELALRLVPRLISRKYGRILFIESQSVKQPVENLVLSNAMRLAVVGFAKTLSREIASSGVTVNIIAPVRTTALPLNGLSPVLLNEKNSLLRKPKKRYQKPSRLEGWANRKNWLRLLHGFCPPTQVLLQDKPSVMMAEISIMFLGDTLMLQINIPGREKLEFQYLVLDFNGTLALDGYLKQGVPPRLKELSEYLKIYVLTADTHGSVHHEMEGMPCEVHVIRPDRQDEAKADFIRKLGGDKTISIGNGLNDRMMLQEAKLGLLVIQEEGVATAAYMASDVICSNINDALDLLLKPDRLRATLRN